MFEDIVQEKEQEKIFYISDLHLGHQNILRFDNRPFSSLEEMENVMVEKWNSRVTDKDFVYIIGDFIWGKDSGWPEKVSKFKGKKILIRGNHDPKQLSKATRKLFYDAKDYMEIRDNYRNVILCHYPIMFYRHSFNLNQYMLCGHVHITKENELLEKWTDELRDCAAKNREAPQGNIYNVGCMMPWMEYEPKTLDEIIAGYVRYKASKGIVPEC